MNAPRSPIIKQEEAKVETKKENFNILSINQENKKTIVKQQIKKTIIKKEIVPPVPPIETTKLVKQQTESWRKIDLQKNP